MSLCYFTAITPPAEVIAALDALVGPRRTAESAVRWQRAEKWHVTTSFMAQVTTDRIEDLIEKLAELAARTPPFAIRLGGGGCLPDPFAPRVLYIGVRIGASQLSALSTSCRAAASRSGIAADGRKYLPHMTLARGRFAAPRYLDLVDSFGEFSWQATGLTLLASDRQNYTEVAGFPYG